MTFEKKEELVDKYYKWIEDMKKKKNLVVKENVMSVINFLDSLKILKNI